MAEPCPPAPPIGDASLGALIEADAALAFDYARCKEKHRAAVEAYELVRALLMPPEKP